MMSAAPTQTSTQKFRLHGNGCGHNAASPRRYGMAKFKARPQTLEQIKYRAHSLTDKNLGWRNYLKSLRSLRIKEKKTTRLQRSESRHALAWLLSVIADRLDLETMSVGSWDASGIFVPATLSDLHESLKTACNADEDFSFSRVKRHFRQLVQSGYINCKYRFYATGEKDSEGNDIMRQDAAIKYVTEKFLREIGFDLGTKQRRTKFAKQLQKDRQRSTLKNRAIRAAAGIDENIKSLADSALGKSRIWLQSLKAQQRKASIETKKLYNEALHDLLEKNHALTPGQARKLLGPPPR